jgi:deazaflavin-dependent oxidoreductase (nitroreductase family)
MTQSLRLRHGFMRAVDRLTQLAFRISGGRFGGRQGWYDILLLTTTGRKSGEPRTHALLFVRDGERYVVCASNFGAPNDPAWYLNLRTDPHGAARVRRGHFAVTAEDAQGEERARLWRRLVAVWPRYEGYQKGVTRVIPVVILTPGAQLASGP